jgi:hypothetical protein
MTFRLLTVLYIYIFYGIHPHWTSLHELDILSFSNWTLVLS